jgi:hypothetical protein
VAPNSVCRAIWQMESFMANNHLAPYYGALVLHLASGGLFLAHAALRVLRLHAADSPTLIQERGAELVALHSDYDSLEVGG